MKFKKVKRKSGKAAEFFYEKAKATGLRARSAFKLAEATNKYNLLKEGDFILDLGAAPGSWLQIIKSKVGDKGFAVGVDFAEIKGFKEDKNIKILRKDILDKDLESVVLAVSGKKFDAVLSDAAPKTTGIHHLDQEKSIEILRRVFEIADAVLSAGGGSASGGKEGGVLFAKVYEGPDLEEFIKQQRPKFEILKRFKPSASRAASKELFLLGLGFLGGK